MSEFNIIMPIHYWCNERLGRGLSTRVVTVLPWIFITLDSLYEAVKNLSWDSLALKSINGNPRIEGSGVMTIVGFDLSPQVYRDFRATISLIGDVYHLIESISKLDLLELTSPINQLYSEANKFRDLRNFFTHINEQISKLNENGISGSCKTNCGIEYVNAQGCFHLVLSESKVHFSYKGQAKEVDFGKDSFERIFEAARVVYAELIKHSNANYMNYRPANNLYTL